MVKLNNKQKFNHIHLFAISATYRPSPMGLWCTRWKANRKMRMERRSNIKLMITCNNFQKSAAYLADGGQILK